MPGEIVITCVLADPSASSSAVADLIASACPVTRTRILNERAQDIYIEGDRPSIVRQSVESKVGSKLDALRCDRIYQPVPTRHKRLFITDMDSTVIECECIDELAEEMGIKPKIAEITRSAMEGKIDFVGAVRRRVGMLKGMSTKLLDNVYDRIRISPGAEQLMLALRKNNIRTVLVSGGFTFFAARIARRLGFDDYYANELEIQSGCLTGKITGPVVTKTTKLRLMHFHANALNAGIDEIVSLGDGANDLPMLEGAGLGIAYRAKPVVEAAIGNRIRFTDLETVAFAVTG